MPFSDSAPCYRWPIAVSALALVLAAAFVLQLDDEHHKALLKDFARHSSDWLGAWKRTLADPGDALSSPLVFLRDILRPLLGASLLCAGPIHACTSIAYLFVFGDNIEGRLGRVRFAVLWLVGACVAGVVHALLHVEEALPGVGASGAIAALLGAYALLFRGARIRFVRFLEFPCFAAILAFFVLQIGPVQTALGWVDVLDGIDVRAHLASFAAGALLAPLLCIANPCPEPRSKK